jgi:class I fructose-bisphosphate aldolase
MIGKEIRISRLFHRGKAFVVALDHGFVMGPLKGIEQVTSLVPAIAKAGPDALQMTPPMITIVKESFLSRSSPMIIARLDTSNVWRHHKRAEAGYYSLSFSVKEAVRSGADAVVTYLVVGYGDDRVEGYNLNMLSEVRRESEDYGIPLIVEPLFIEKNTPDSVKETEVVRYVARLASELGADLLKVDYTGDKSGFSSVVRSSFVPILTRGGPKSESEVKFLEMLSEAIQAGAKGVTVGRNLWQHQRPEVMAKAISMVVHEGISPTEALRVITT